MKFYKIVNPKGHNGLVYHEGLNTDPLPFNPSGDCESGGIYFAREDILAFLDYGSDLYEVDPIGEIYENPTPPRKWKCKSVMLTYVGKTVDCIGDLIKAGADIHADYDLALRLSAKEGQLDVVKLLIKAGADIHACDDYALRLSAEAGQLDVVKLLIKAGADIHARNDFALRWSAEEGHLDMVKLLIKAGADIHARNDFALRWSARAGHLDVAEYLKSISA